MLLLTTVILVLLSPWLVPKLLAFSAILLGSYIRYKSSSRRDLLLTSSENKADIQSRAQQDEDTRGDDLEWEKVDRDVTEAAPNGHSLDNDWTGVVGFFHPFCNAGGGGERVLWAAIRATQDRWPNAVCVVYTGDHDAEKDAIIKRVRERFNIRLNPHKLHFLYLSTRHYVLASTWPHFTLLGQSVGSLILALDAFHLMVPDLYIDTMGFAFTIALSKFLFPDIPTAAYVHYPTISTDMLSSLDAPASADRGLNAGAGQGLKGKLKRRYWQLFAKAYTFAGSFVDVIMTNSSWTRSHIQELWGASNSGRISDISVVFPPVAVEELEQQIEVSTNSESSRRPHILYIAQFRPEKNHTLILTAFSQLLSSRKWATGRRPRLVLVGSVRDRDDATRVYKLRLHAHEAQMKEDVEFVCDASWPQVLDHLGKSSIGVNGMWNEHFGIGVVEYQASGLISVVNDSGGPKMDIVVDVDGKPTGFHASTPPEYAAAFAKALDLSTTEMVDMRLRARKSATRFSEENFAQQWIENMERLVSLQRNRRQTQ